MTHCCPGPGCIASEASVICEYISHCRRESARPSTRRSIALDWSQGWPMVQRRATASIIEVSFGHHLKENALAVFPSMATNFAEQHDQIEVGQRVIASCCVTRPANQPALCVVLRRQLCIDTGLIDAAKALTPAAKVRSPKEERHTS